MPAGKRAARRSARPRFVALPAVAAFILIAVGYAVAGPGTDWVSRLTGSTDTSSGPESTEPASALGCADLIDAGEATMRVARTGVVHWEAHVQARTDMLSGAITADEASAIWARTRLAGPGDLRRFDRADRAYRRAATTPACPRASVDRGEATRVTRSGLNDACDTRARLTAAAVTAARAAIGDWQAHQAKMAAFADHKFSAEHAQRMWIQAWSSAPGNIDEFHRADRRLRGAPSCPSSTSTG